jgi:hypothetical protein
MPSPVPKPLLSMVAPAETELLELIKANLSRLMLEEMAANDYGEEASEHLVAIQRQLGPNPPLGLLPWNPREVLELERWSEPDHNEEGSPPSGRHGHWKRLLASTILLRNGAYIEAPQHLSEESYFLDTSASTIVQLTRSAIALGSNTPSTALTFLLWLYEKPAYPGLIPFVAFGALLLATASGLHNSGDKEILEVCAWVNSEETSCRKAFAADDESGRWLIGLNSYEESRPGRWRSATQDAIEHLPRKSSREVADAFSGFVELLQP